MHSQLIRPLTQRGHFRATKTLLVSLMLCLLTSPSEGADQEVRLDLETNGGLFLPEGFEAEALVSQLDGQARHIAVDNNGDVYVKLREAYEEHGNAVLRDTDGDGQIDEVRYFGKYPMYGRYGTAMRIHDGYLYFSSQKTVYRQKLSPGEIVPKGDLEEIFVDPNEPR